MTVAGHAAMEAACCNLIEPGDVVLVAWNGTWGERFSDMAARNGTATHRLTVSVPAAAAYSCVKLPLLSTKWGFKHCLTKHLTAGISIRPNCRRNLDNLSCKPFRVAQNIIILNARTSGNKGCRVSFELQLCRFTLGHF